MINIYTPNGYIVPAKFALQFLPRMKNVPKRTQLYLNEIGLTNTEIFKSQIQLRQPPISWKMCSFTAFCNTGVMIPVTAIIQGCKRKHSLLKYTMRQKFSNFFN